tara:strand:+ start:665 stop:877 length:213 start_codon:yes stop_codon:yes gene_type:complete
MSGWTKIIEGNIELVHHSTSSIVELILHDTDEFEPGQFRKDDKTIWLDYYDFENLKKAIAREEQDLKSKS